MDDLFDILIESGGKDIASTSQSLDLSCRGYRALRAESVAAQVFAPASLPMPSALAVVIKAAMEMSVRC